MSMKIKMILLTFVLLFLPTVLATNDTFQMPAFSDAWNNLDNAYVKSRIMWLVGLSVVCLVISAIIASAVGGTKASWASITGNVSGRASGVSTIIITIGVVFAAFLAGAMILWISG